jgi:DNA-binding transcriptional MerR regulator
MEKTLLTAKDIAVDLGIAESTLRYWRDRYETFIPHTGKGKRRRYPREAIEVFSFIADVSQTLTTSEEVITALDGRFDRIIEEVIEGTATQQPQHNKATAQQMLPIPRENILPIVQSMIAETLSQTLSTIADQKTTIEDIQSRLTKLESPPITKKKPRHKQQTIEDIIKDIFKETAVIDRALNHVDERL